MRCLLLKTSRRGLESYEVRIYSSDGTLRHRHAAFSLEGVRTWLAEQGIPFNKQPKHVHDCLGGN